MLYFRTLSVFATYTCVLGSGLQCCGREVTQSLRLLRSWTRCGQFSYYPSSLCGLQRPLLLKSQHQSRLSSGTLIMRHILFPIIWGQLLTSLDCPLAINMLSRKTSPDTSERSSFGRTRSPNHQSASNPKRRFDELAILVRLALYGTSTRPCGLEIGYLWTATSTKETFMGWEGDVTTEHTIIHTQAFHE